MTFNELKSLVSYWVDDLQQTYFTPAQLKVFINNAQIEVQKRLVRAGSGYYMKCVTTPLVLNQREYVLPSDFLELNKLETVVSGTVPQESTNPVSPITPSQKDLLFQATGNPSAYFFKKNRLVLYPAPDTVYTLRMYYSYRLVALENDYDVPDVPEEFQELIAIQAAYDCLVKDGRDPSALVRKLDMFDEMLKSMAAQRNVDESRSVIMSGSYMDDYGSWGFY